MEVWLEAVGACGGKAPVFQRLLWERQCRAVVRIRVECEAEPQHP